MCKIVHEVIKKSYTIPNKTNEKKKTIEEINMAEPRTIEKTNPP